MTTCAVAAITLAMLTRATDPARLAHWWSFSHVWAVVGLIFTAAVLTLVSAIGVLAKSTTGSSGAGPAWLQAAIAALLAHASLRRLKSSNRGGSLALGLLPDLNKWIAFFVQSGVARWASTLDDYALVAAAARLDNKSLGMPSKASFDQRVAWRLEVADRLNAGVSVRETARMDLIDLVEKGYSTYNLRKTR